MKSDYQILTEIQKIITDISHQATIQISHRLYDLLLNKLDTETIRPYTLLNILIAMQKAISNITENPHIGRPLNDHQHRKLVVNNIVVGYDLSSTPPMITTVKYNGWKIGKW